MALKKQRRRKTKEQIDTNHTLVGIGGGCRSVVEAGVEGERVLHGGGKMWKA
jgi:hypothetical protein